MHSICFCRVLFLHISYQDTLVYCQRDSHATPQPAIYTQTGRIRYIVDGFGSFWLVLLVVVGGFGWFWVVLADFSLGGFGWFHVLVTAIDKN